MISMLCEASTTGRLGAARRQYANCHGNSTSMTFAHPIHACRRAGRASRSTRPLKIACGRIHVRLQSSAAAAASMLGLRYST
jgi:hypothetical protein